MDGENQNVQNTLAFWIPLSQQLCPLLNPPSCLGQLMSRQHSEGKLSWDHAAEEATVLRNLKVVFLPLRSLASPTLGCKHGLLGGHRNLSKGVINNLGLN